MDRLTRRQATGTLVITVIVLVLSTGQCDGSNVLASGKSDLPKKLGQHGIANDVKEGTLRMRSLNDAKGLSHMKVGVAEKQTNRHELGEPGQKRSVIVHDSEGDVLGDADELDEWIWYTVLKFVGVVAVVIWLLRVAYPDHLKV